MLPLSHPPRLAARQGGDGHRLRFDKNVVNCAMESVGVSVSSPIVRQAVGLISVRLRACLQLRGGHDCVPASSREGVQLRACLQPRGGHGRGWAG
jgi:hypothetical protein